MQQMRSTELIADVFKQCTEKPAPTGKGYRTLAGTTCLIYKGSPDRYGNINWEGQRLLTHRLVFEHATGECLPPDIVVRHKCDRKGCVRPSHLESGTHLDNFLDAQKRCRNPAFGNRNGAHQHPERIPRGVRTHGRRLKDSDAAAIKNALKSYKNPAWEDFVSIAAYFRTTPDQIKAIACEQDFVSVSPIGSICEIPHLSSETLTVKYPDLVGHALSHQDVADIRFAYFACPNSEKRAVKKLLREKYCVSKATIQKVLNRETFKEVAPEIPITKEAGSGVASLSDSEVQSIRATWAAHPQLQNKGLSAALSRKFGVSHPTIDRIIDGSQRPGIPLNPLLALTVEELEFKELNQRGESHPMRKLDEDKVREIRRLKEKEGLTNDRIAKLFGVTKENVGMIVRKKTWKHVE